MNYKLFLELYNQAAFYSNFDMYISERGWQPWFENYGTEEDMSKIIEILECIYTLGNMDMREMREYAKISRNEFSRIYDIPSRTIQAWEYGNNQMPKYTKTLIAYTIFTEKLFEDAKVIASYTKENL